VSTPEPLSTEELRGLESLCAGLYGATETDPLVKDVAWRTFALIRAHREQANEVDRLKAELADLEGQNDMTESNFTAHVAESILEQGALTRRVEAAEAVMRKALTEVEHEEVVYLLNRYLTERGAVSE
jgi:hypothetical protein